MPRRSTFGLFYLLSVSLFAAIGCGSSTPKGTVSGKVMHKNKAVVWGTVTLIASDNMTYHGTITVEGTYSIPNVPSGPVKFCVISPNPEPGKRGGLAGGRPSDDDRGVGGDPGNSNQAVSLVPKGAWFPIHPKYADAQKSGLTGTVDRDTIIDLKLD